MSYQAKLLLPYYEYAQIHIRGKGDTNRDEAADLIKDFPEADGYSRLPTLCGTYVASKQSVLQEVDKSKICENCKRIAEAQGRDISRVLAN